MVHGVDSVVSRLEIVRAEVNLSGARTAGECVLAKTIPGRMTLL